MSTRTVRDPRRVTGVLTVLLVSLVAALLAGCSTLPTSGEVNTRPDKAAEAAGQAPYFAPPGPSAGDDRQGVVRGFLLAMQANPPSTAVARKFLSRQARSGWKPVQGTIVYATSSVQATSEEVTARFADAHRLDPAGAWVQGAAATTRSIDFDLVQEDGEWRISNPPNALAVPASYFPSLFVPVVLYFYDQTGTVLVPRRVYIPRGEQTATNLVRGLLAGPGSDLDGVARSAFPAGTDLDLAVVVDDSGVAEVPLGPDSPPMTPGQLSRALDQVARTLRQVPGINRVRLTENGSPLALADGRTDVGVNSGSELDPVVASSHDLVAIVGKRVVREIDGTVTPVAGPLGRPGFALRSVALDVARHRIAAVSSNGRQLYLAADRGSTAAARVQTPLTGTNLLRPAFDRFGRLWVVDARPDGAVVHVISGSQDRQVDVPGITGRGLSAFTLTRDGARFVATLRTGTSPVLLVAPIARAANGGVVEVLPATTLPVSVSGLGADLSSDLGPALDVAQNSATTVVVLVRPTPGTARVLPVELDGSPGIPRSGPPEVVPGVVVAVLASPDPNDTVRVVTDERRLLELTPDGEWIRTVADVIAAAYPQ